MANTTHYNYILPEATDNVELDYLNQNFSDIDGDIYEAQSDADSAKDRLDIAEPKIQQNSDDIGGLTGRVSSLEDTVGDSTDGLVKDVSDLQTDMGLVEDAIGDIDADINTASTGIKARLTAVENDLSSLQGTVGGISDDLDTCEGVVAGHTSDISTISDDINNVSTGLKARVSSLETEVGNLNTTVGGHTSTLTTLGGKVSALETTVGNNSSGLVKDVNDLKAKKYLHTVCYKWGSLGTAVIIEMVSSSSTALNDYINLIDGLKFVAKSNVSSIVGLNYEAGVYWYALQFDLTETEGYKWVALTDVDPDTYVIGIKEIEL